MDRQQFRPSARLSAGLSVAQSALPIASSARRSNRQSLHPSSSSTVGFTSSVYLCVRPRITPLTLSSVLRWISSTRYHPSGRFDSYRPPSWRVLAINAPNVGDARGGPVGLGYRYLVTPHWCSVYRSH